MILLTVIGAPVPAFAHAQESDWESRPTAGETTIGASPTASSDTDLLDVLDFAFLLTGEATKGGRRVIGEFNDLVFSDDFTFPVALSAVRAR